VISLLERLDSLEKLEKGWDSYGAEPISASAIIKARELIEKIVVNPRVDGGLELSLGEETLDIYISPDGGVFIEID